MVIPLLRPQTAFDEIGTTAIGRPRTGVGDTTQHSRQVSEAAQRKDATAPRPLPGTWMKHTRETRLRRDMPIKHAGDVARDGEPVDRRHQGLDNHPGEASDEMGRVVMKSGRDFNNKRLHLGGSIGFEHCSKLVARK
jgi:hypothetical protein